MDFIILSALIGVTLCHVLITYDIGCQWSKNRAKRMLDFPESMHMSANTVVDIAIPSWHINGHGVACHENFCLSYMKGVGKMCGGEVEISWSHTNPLTTSVREMGPAARHDTLNDHWNGWNFRRTVALRMSSPDISCLLLFYKQVNRYITGAQIERSVQE